MLARPGEILSALTEVPIIRSSSGASPPADSRARAAALAAMSVLLSVVHTWRSFTPTRLVIHSSEVSTILDSSSLVITFSGKKLPVPSI